MVHALSLLEPFVVARVSRDESSLYLVDEWGVAKEDDLTGPWLKTSDRDTGEVSIKDYFAAARQDALVELHYKEVATTLAKWLEGSPVRRVVLCAQHDIASAFRRALPPAVAPKVTAEIPFDADITTSQMLVNARVAANEARQRELVQLVARIKEGLGAKGHGAAGFDEVRDGLERGQIQTMVVERNYRPLGWTCPDCDWAGLTPVEGVPHMWWGAGADSRCGRRVGALGHPPEQPGGSGRGHPDPRRDGRGSGAAAIRVARRSGAAAASHGPPRAWRRRRVAGPPRVSRRPGTRAAA